MERKRGIYEKHSKIEETWGESSSSRLPNFGPAVWAMSEHRVFIECPPPEQPMNKVLNQFRQGHLAVVNDLLAEAFSGCQAYLQMIKI